MSMMPKVAPKAPSAPKAPVAAKPKAPRASLAAECKRPVPKPKSRALSSPTAPKAAAPKAAAPKAVSAQAPKTAAPKVSKVGKADAPPSYRPTFAALRPKLAGSGGPAFGKSHRVQMAQAMSGLTGNYAALGMKSGAQALRFPVRPRSNAPTAAAPKQKPAVQTGTKVFAPYTPKPRGAAGPSPKRLALMNLGTPKPKLAAPKAAPKTAPKAPNTRNKMAMR
jgi:hypothetical protein